MIRVGITGGMGSGKTAFCKVWEKLGAYVLYADDFAKQLMQEDEELKQKITQAFGEGSYLSNGNLNRKYLAKEAFEKGRVEELNNLVHPVLWERVKILAEEKKQQGFEIFAEEAAILLNNGRPEGLDYVILISADQNKRIQRVSDRDKSNRDQIMARMNKQPDFTALSNLSDFIVLNDGSLDELEIKAGKVFDKIKQIG